MDDAKHNKSAMAARLLEKWLLEHKATDGMLLPSQRELAEQLGVSRSSLTGAIATLKDRGLLHAQRGSGTYVSHCFAAQAENYEPRDANDLDHMLAADGTPQVPTDDRPLALITLNSWSRVSRLMMKGFSDMAHRLGREVISTESQVSREGQAEAILRVLTQKPAGVAMLNTFTSPPEHVKSIQAMGIPVVLLGGPIQSVVAPCVRSGADVIGSAFGKLIDGTGHRRIALCPLHMTGLWKEVASTFRTELGLSISQQHILTLKTESAPTDGNIPQLRLFAERVMSSPEPPSLFITAADSIAYELIWVLNELGHNVPGDLSVVTLGTRERDGRAAELAAVTYDVRWAGAKAADLLGKMLTGELPIQCPELACPPVSAVPGKSLKSLTSDATIDVRAAS